MQAAEGVDREVSLMSDTVYTPEQPHPALAKMRKIVQTAPDHMLERLWEATEEKRRSDPNNEDLRYVRVVLAVELEKRGL